MAAHCDIALATQRLLPVDPTGARHIAALPVTELYAVCNIYITQSCINLHMVAQLQLSLQTISSIIFHVQYMRQWPVAHTVKIKGLHSFTLKCSTSSSYDVLVHLINTRLYGEHQGQTYFLD
jgi:hypothetical protein